MKKKILITGGTGLIGPAIVRSLLNENFDVYLVSRKPVLSIHNEKLKLITFDILAEPFENLIKKISDINIIIHGASFLETKLNFENLQIHRKFIEFTEKLFSFSGKSQKESLLIYLSSFAFLKRPLEKIITEEHPVCAINPYSINKYWGELVLFNLPNKNIRPVSLRISSPVSDDINQMPDTVVKKWISQVSVGNSVKVYGSGKRTQDFVSTIDIAKAVIQIIKNNNARGTYNITSGTSVSMNELAEIIADKFSAKIIHCGEDVNENDRWNISIKKSQNEFNYNPIFTSKQAIENLLNKII